MVTRKLRERRKRESGEHEKKSFDRRTEGLGKGNLGKEERKAAAASEDIHTRPKLPSAKWKKEVVTLVKDASVTVEPDWPRFFAKLCEKRNIEDRIVEIGFGGGAAVSVAAFLLRPSHLLLRVQL